jgi:hypothetical protein
MTSPVIQADSILHPERIVGNPQPWDCFRFAPDTSEMAQYQRNGTAPASEPEAQERTNRGINQSGVRF